MKTTSKFLALVFLASVFTGCSDDDNGPELAAVESKTATNIPAPQTGGPPSADPVGGPFTKFSFETGAVTTDDDDWDIAFRGLAIAVNGGASTGANDEPERNGIGGASVVTGTFASVTTVEGLEFEQDSGGGFAIPRVNDEGWYNYNGQTNTVSALPGRVMVIKTHDGKYAKVEILSYYKNAPTEITEDIARQDSRFYTFNYVYNPNEGETTF